MTVVTTVLNEAGQLADLLESIERQKFTPAEVIVVDGGSTDRSLSILDQWSNRLPLRIVLRPGANISGGRNCGIALATSPLIAVTDAGVVLEPDWLERLVAPLTQEIAPIDVVAGFFLPDPRNQFEEALAASTLPDAGEIDPERFLPSSRSVAFRKSWFDTGVRYPEWLDYCEDIVFALRLKRAGARFLFQPDAIVRFRPRRDLAAFWRQYYLYARGDGRAGLFWKRHLVRYLAYLVIAPSFILVRSPLWKAAILLGGLAYMRRPAIRTRARTNLGAAETCRLVVLSALLRVVGDVAKMAGYPVGLLWRARNYGLKRDWLSIPEAGDCN